ncbi:MAG: hypothetical protein MI919_21160 [Holophagales bacterium]|nr:hypothetical protein [Holophagales bacterium]
MAPDPRSPIAILRAVARALAGLGFVVLWAWSVPSTVLADSAEPEPQDPGGFLYGRIETRYESWEGRLRWDEEAFWDQYLDARKVHQPLRRAVPLEHRRKTARHEVFGASFTHTVPRRRDRQISIRFGDLAAIEPRNREWSTLVLRDGRRVEVENGRDIRTEIQIWERGGEEAGKDASDEKIEVPWSRIRRIVFLPTPGDLETEERRLFGRAETSYGTFEGAVQWDRDECTASDLLDGDDASGERQRIPMGEIAYLEPARLEGRGQGTRVGLVDGRVLELDGTNDVEPSNRGVWIHDPRWGRVAIPWRHLRRLELRPSSASGPSYGSFAPAHRLTGTVETRSGDRHRGYLAYDVDEQESWEVLDGRLRDRPADSDAAGGDGSRHEAGGSLAGGSAEGRSREEPSGAGKPAQELEVSMELETPELVAPGGRDPAPGVGDPEGLDALALDLVGADWRRGLEVDIHFERIVGIEPVRSAPARPEEGEGSAGDRAPEEIASRVWLDSGEVLELGGSQDVDENQSGLVILPLSAGWAGTSRTDSGTGSRENPSNTLILPRANPTGSP